MSTSMSEIRTVKVSNVSLSATKEDISSFFSFSGEIEYIEMRSGDEKSRVAYVTFKNPQGAETSLLLTDARIVDLTVTITPATDYQLPADASNSSSSDVASAKGTESNVQKAEDVISTMLAKGLVLGKDALEKAKSFDEQHKLTSTAKTKVSTMDQKIGLSEKLSTGTKVVNEKVSAMDDKYQVSGKARSAYVAAEQKVSDVGSVAMKNKYVCTSVSWMKGAVGKVAKTANEVGMKAVEKAAAEQQQKRPSSESDRGDQGHSPAKNPVSASSPHPNTN